MKKLFTKASTAVTALALSASPVFAAVPTPRPGGPLSRITVSRQKGFASDIGNLIEAVLTFVMVIAALLLLFYLIWGGIEWITSGGDKGKTESARNKITAAVIGMIVLASAFAVMTLVLNFLGFGSLNEVFQQASGL